MSVDASKVEIQANDVCSDPDKPGRAIKRHRVVHWKINEIVAVSCLSNV